MANKPKKLPPFMAAKGTKANDEQKGSKKKPMPFFAKKK